MKHTNYFNDFLINEFNLNQTRLDVLKQKMTTLTSLRKKI